MWPALTVRESSRGSIPAVRCSSHSEPCHVGAFLSPVLLIPCEPVVQDIYKYVTHEKGLLGSQGDYNARHRRLCAPPFRNKQQLQRFADVVVQR